jgi:2-acylglycerol O-acyltransferase 1
LPAWQDCYENAARAEWLGIGVYGNKTRAPNISAKELSKALLKVMNNKSYKDKSVEFSRLCHTKGGRVTGAEKIVEIAQNPDKMFLNLPDVDLQDPKCKLYEIRNRAGMVLQTTQEPKVEENSPK